MTFTVETEREDDGRWLAKVPAFPGVMVYGADRDEAVARVQALALRVIAGLLTCLPGAAHVRPLVGSKPSLIHLPQRR